MKWAKSEGAVRCSGGPTSGALALRRWLEQEYPAQYSLGIYNCRPVAGSSTLSTHAEGRAYDMGMQLVSGRGNPIGHDAIKRIGEVGDQLGIQRAIFDRTIWDQNASDGRPYRGVSPHYDHVHWELTRWGSKNLTLELLNEKVGKTMAEATSGFIGLKEGDSGETVKALQRMVNTIDASLLSGSDAKDFPDGNWGQGTSRDLGSILHSNNSPVRVVDGWAFELLLEKYTNKQAEVALNKRPNNVQPSVDYEGLIKTLDKRYIRNKDSVTIERK